MIKPVSARVLFAPVVKPDLPQCEAERANSYFNDRPNTDRRCKHSARFEIDGLKLCQKHAGVKALEIVLKQGEGKRNEECIG